MFVERADILEIHNEGIEMSDSRETNVGLTVDDDEVVRRYSQRLIAFARTRLPMGMARRVDPEDVVQSAYRSFFRRLKKGELVFDEEHDVWQLLATITFCKTKNLIKHHHRQRRDARREEPDASGGGVVDREPGVEDVAMFFESLKKLLSALPAEYHEFVLLRMDGYSIEEIATRVQRSQRTVLRVLARVRELGEAQSKAEA